MTCALPGKYMSGWFAVLAAEHCELPGAVLPNTAQSIRIAGEN
jgi:hypothetical protein